MSQNIFYGFMHTYQPTHARTHGHTRGVIVNLDENGPADTRSILDKVYCILHGTNNLGKGIDQIILLQVSENSLAACIFLT